MKFPSNMLLVMSVYALFGFSACENFPVPVERIHVVNNSDHNIRSHIPLSNGPFYPDTSLTTVISGSMQNTSPGRKAYFDHHGRGSIAELLEASPLGLVSIFIFHPDTLADYSDEEIIAGYKVLARYDLSLSNLETLDFFVPYPPSDAMGEMRVYVPQ